VSILRVRGLTAGYGGAPVLHEVDLDVAHGAITAVLGANGAGKTTLLRAISGMIRPRRGRILLDGTDQAGRSPEQMVRAGIAHVPEGQGVIPELTVEENLRVGMMSWPPTARRVPGRSRADRGAALDEAFERFPPLAARRRKLAAALSGGERQMLVIARALLARPRVLLLDEPSLGLAPLIVQRIMAQIVALRAAGGTVLVVEQNARAALGIADRGYVLENGAITVSGRAGELLDNPVVQDAYLGGQGGSARGMEERIRRKKRALLGR